MGRWSDVDIAMGETSDRRVKLVRIAVPMLPLLLRRGSRWELVEHPLPDDARVVGSRLERPDEDPRHATLVLIIRSAEYPEVPMGGDVPEAQPPAFHDPGTEDWHHRVACGEPNCDERVHAGRNTQCESCRGFYCDRHRKYATFKPDGSSCTLCLDCIGPPDQLY